MENKELFSALAKAQAGFKTPKKDKKAHYGHYASIGSINEAVRDSLTKNGLSIVQPIVSIDTICYVKTIVTHSSGQMLESTMPIPTISKPQKNFFHELGAAISYLRRYSLQSILNVSSDDIEDDGDSLNGVGVEHKKPASRRSQNKNNITSIDTQEQINSITEKQEEELRSIFRDLDKEKQGEFFKEYKKLGANYFSEIKSCDYNLILEFGINLSRKEG